MGSKLFDKETEDKISFVTFIIPMFARAFKLNKQQTYFYLKKFGGLDYLFRHWWTLHAEDTYWSMRDLYKICYKNGGIK